MEESKNKRDKLHQYTPIKLTNNIWAKYIHNFLTQFKRISLALRLFSQGKENIQTEEHICVSIG